MGNLKPGATYVYERVDDTVYAREIGAKPEDRFVIGYDWNGRRQSVEGAIERTKERQEWKEILEESRTNSALRDAVEHVKIIYRLSKTNE